MRLFIKRRGIPLIEQHEDYWVIRYSLQSTERKDYKQTFYVNLTTDGYWGKTFAETLEKEYAAEIIGYYPRPAELIFQPIVNIPAWKTQEEAEIAAEYIDALNLAWQLETSI